MCDKVDVINAFKEAVIELRAKNLYVDAKLEIDKEGNVTAKLEADNHPR